MIIDNQIVITGSYHFTSEEESQNSENLLILSSSGVAEQYHREFSRRLVASRSN